MIEKLVIDAKETLGTPRGAARAWPRIDVHQHVWTEPLLAALAARDELPFVRDEHDLTVLFAAGEHPYVIDVAGEARAERAELLARDEVQRALVCLSSPLGIECLPRERSQPLLDAYHEGALALGEPFGVWGSLALDRPDPTDVDSLLDRGCVGVSLPAGALSGLDALARVRPLLRRLEDAAAPLLVHPGPAPTSHGLAPTHDGPSLADPLWWPAMTRYVSQMHAAWLTFVGGGRAEHPRLRVVFAMLAGLAPLHVERLAARGGPAPLRDDPLTFYETSSYGSDSARRLTDVVGAGQLLYGSDRPVVDPADVVAAADRDWRALADATRRAFGDRLPAPLATVVDPALDVREKVLAR